MEKGHTKIEFQRTPRKSKISSVLLFVFTSWTLRLSDVWSFQCSESRGRSIRVGVLNVRDNRMGH